MIVDTNRFKVISFQKHVLDPISRYMKTMNVSCNGYVCSFLFNVVALYFDLNVNGMFLCMFIYKLMSMRKFNIERNRLSKFFCIRSYGHNGMPICYKKSKN